MYKLKHKKTGLYWQPLYRRNSNLCKIGTVFTCINNANIALETGKVLKGIVIQRDSSIFKSTRNIIDYNFHDMKTVKAETVMSDWEIEKVES